VAVSALLRAQGHGRFAPLRFGRQTLRNSIYLAFSSPWRPRASCCSRPGVHFGAYLSAWLSMIVTAGRGARPALRDMVGGRAPGRPCGSNFLFEGRRDSGSTPKGRSRR